MQSISQLHNVKLQTEYVATDKLAPLQGTPRPHPNSQIRSLAKSLEAFGQVLPILIESEGRIISDHALWQAATRLGMSEGSGPTTENAHENLYGCSGIRRSIIEMSAEVPVPCLRRCDRGHVHPTLKALSAPF